MSDEDWRYVEAGMVMRGALRALVRAEMSAAMEVRPPQWGRVAVAELAEALLDAHQSLDLRRVRGADEKGEVAELVRECVRNVCARYTDAKVRP